MDKLHNLDQIRAKNALGVRIGEGAGGGESVAKKVPAMIRENGIIAAAAFALETGKGYKDVFEALIKHLADVDCLPAAPAPAGSAVSHRGSLLEAFVAGLCSAKATQLRVVTAESLAYLNYLRRFAKMANGEG